MMISFSLSSAFKFFDRFISTYLWLYPMLYTFWPNNRRKNEENNYNTSIQSLNESFRSNKSNNSNSNFNSAKSKSTAIAHTESVDCDLNEYIRDYDDAKSDNSADSSKDQVGVPNNTDYLGLIGQGIKIKRVVDMQSSS